MRADTSIRRPFESVTDNLCSTVTAGSFAATSTATHRFFAGALSSARHRKYRPSVVIPIPRSVQKLCRLNPLASYSVNSFAASARLNRGARSFFLPSLIPRLQQVPPFSDRWVAHTLTVEKGFAVFAINPKQVDRFRDRFTVAGAKDDSRDALVMADSLRTDQKSYKRVQIDDPFVIRLRELSRMETELKDGLRQATNRLWEQLHRNYPQLLQLSSAADDLFVWELLRKAPNPRMGAKLTKSRLQKLLAAHRISRFNADEALIILRSLPLQLAPGAADAASERVLLLLPQIVLLDQQVRNVGRRIKHLLNSISDQSTDTSEPHDITLMLSIPGVGPGIASTLYSEASGPIQSRDYGALRCYAGTAPVTKQSAKRKSVNMRYACNPRIRQAMHHWANRSIMCDERSRQHYDRLRAAGHRHPRAIRGLADRLLEMLIAMLRKGEKYDPQRRSLDATRTTSGSAKIDIDCGSVIPISGKLIKA